MIKLEERLKEFQCINNILSKGPLSLVMQFTRMVRDKEFPLDYNDFQTSSKGQVAGLIEKCNDNLRAGLHPVIITISERVHTAFNLAEDADIAERVEVLDIRQLLSANIYEQSLFDDGKRNLILSELVSCYNDIVLQTEMDPSLRIEFDAK